MNGNIQVEPIRVKLDKQGATTFLTKVTTVDAIVRPLLTKHTILAKQYQSIRCVVCTQQESFWKKFGDGGVGPPFSNPFQSYPPLQSPARRRHGGARWESFSIRVSQMRIIRIYGGMEGPKRTGKRVRYHPKPFWNTHSLAKPSANPHKCWLRARL